MIYTSKGENTAISYCNNKISYNSLLEQANNYSLLFAEKKPQKVAIFSKNRPEWIYAFYAVWQCNSIVVTIDYMSSLDDVLYILNDCNPDYVFFGNEGAEVINNIKKTYTNNTTFISFDNISVSKNSNKYEWFTPEDVEKAALIIYTSGTTGNPKGVLLSYKNILTNIDAVSIDAPIYKQSSEVLLFLPLHHIFPLLGSMATTLYTGGTIVMSSGMQSSDLTETLKNNKVSIFIGVPRIYELMYNGIKSKINESLVGRIFFKLASILSSKKFSRTVFKKVHQGLGGNIECLVSGGAKLDTKVGRFFTSLGFDVYEGYGMTECAPMITFPRPGNIKIGTTGKALKNVDIKITEGEITVKGPNVMLGYYNRPDETAEIIKNGWLHTGDLGFIDKKGYLHITGRKKEIIVLPSGKNINPVLIESKLELTSDYISEAALLLNKGAVHALIVPNYHKLAEAGITEPEKYFRETVIPEFNSTLTPYQRIMKFSIITNDIPRTRLGKIQRFKLDDLLNTSTKEKKQPVAEPRSEEYNSIKIFIEGQIKQKVYANYHLEFDIALDSLGKLSLIDFIENTFGIELSQESLLSFASIKKLAEYVADNKLKHNIESTNWAEILKNKSNIELPESSVMHSGINIFLRYFFKIYFRFSGYGINNLPEGSAIIAPNHQSFFDGVFVSALLNNNDLKQTYFYAKKKHIKNRFLKFMANKNNIIVMDLHNNLKESILNLAEVLRMGKKIIIFPEGTRTKNGQLGDFKHTFAILGKELNVPIVPVAISGAYQALPSGKVLPKLFSRIEVRFLEAVYPNNNTSYIDIAENVKVLIDKHIIPPAT